MTLTPLEFEYLRKLVHSHSAIVLDDGKEYLIESRLASLLRQEGIPSIGGLVSQLQNQPFGRLHLNIVEAIATNETWFFRDLHPFDLLRYTVLQELYEQRSGERVLNIWSAGCSTGQEPYSIAMLLCELFPQFADWEIRIIASDISQAALQRARSGKYRLLEVNRGLPAAFLVKYFLQVGDEWQICDRVRQMVQFEQINLAASWPGMPHLDIVFMRNVLIYFDVPTKKQILAKLHQRLGSPGYLFLGGAETTITLDREFEIIKANSATCYRLKGFGPCGCENCKGRNDEEHSGC